MDMPASLTSHPLPQVALNRVSVPAKVLHLIPQETAEKYQVVAFEMTDQLVKLAIVHPEQLKQGFYVALDEIGRKLNRKIELFRTDSASLKLVLSQYRNPLPESQPITAEKMSVPKPPLFELGKGVAFNYLKRIPLSFAKQHRLMCVDFLPPNTYWLVTDSQQQESLKRILTYVEERNKVKVYTIAVSSKEFSDLFDFYESRSEAEVHPPVAVPKPVAEPEKPAEKLPEKQVPTVPEKRSDDAAVIFEPDIQASIVSQSEEKNGLAGFLQRFSQGLGTTQAPAEPNFSGEKPLSAQPLKPLVGGNLGTPKPEQAAGKLLSVAPETEAEKGKVATPVPVVEVTPKEVKAVTQEDGEQIGKLLSKPVESLDELKELLQGGQIPKVVAAIVSFAIHEKASDVHVEVFDAEVRVRYRVDGILNDVISLPADMHAAVVSRIKILSKLRLDETRIPQDGRFDVDFGHAQVDVRVSVMPTIHGEKVVMRILDKNKQMVSLEQLGLSGAAYQNVVKAISRPFGTILATGPTGSGKSTTLYAILNQVATQNVNVVTLEDPVEYEMKGVNQSQIRPKIGFTFAEGLRSILRQDPNIIMVGEIRDGETANMATQAALTGHLVLSTLHTNDASGAIPRLTNMGIEPFLITSSLNAAIGQRLVRKICQSCKKEVNLPEGVRQKIIADLKHIQEISPTSLAEDPEKVVTFYQGAGCAVCEGKGYQGRIGIFEVLVMSESIEELTLKRASSQQIAEVAEREGMLTMYQDGLLKVLKGVTTLDEVLRESVNK